MEYLGKELPAFSEATNFHRYYARLFGGLLRGDVLEVGAGLGSFTEQVLKCGAERVTVCEPDPGMAALLAEKLEGKGQVVVGGIRDLPEGRHTFDTIVYVDVMEHIEDDQAEIVAAAKRLKLGGTLAIGGPAHSWLYSEFDAALGHYRRYDRHSMKRLIGRCDSLQLERFLYFDCFGMMLSLGNRWITQQILPTRRQVRFWNSFVLPLSRLIDPFLMYRIGKSFAVTARRSC